MNHYQEALNRIRKIHYDAGQSQGFFKADEGYSERDHCCAACGSFGEYGVEWPCPTIRAIETVTVSPHTSKTPPRVEAEDAVSAETWSVRDSARPAAVGGEE